MRLAPPRESLKRSVLLGVSGLAVLGAVAVGSLVWITTVQDRAAEGIFRALDGVRVCEELRLRMLLHARSRDAVVRAHLEDRLRMLGRELEVYALTAGEQSKLREVERALEGYLRSGGGPTSEPQLMEAFAAVDELSDLEAARARALRSRSATLDAWANRVGAATAVLVALGGTLALLWLRSAVVEPVLLLRNSIQRYAGGDRDARAAVRRPAELREIGERFNEMADALARKRQEEMAFLGAVAHDIRNPLSVVATSLAGLGDRPLDDQTERLLSILGRQVEQIGRLVADLLDAARLEATELPVRMEIYDLRRCAQEVAQLFALRAGAERIDLRIPDGAVLAQVDPSRVHQALANVVGNALKYSPEDRPVQVVVQRTPDAAEVSVRDHGPGISPADRAHLFEPFRRVPGADRTASGAGLGLFIADRIVRAHGGRIELDSEPGRGSTFRLWFPVSAPEGAGPRSARA